MKGSYIAFFALVGFVLLEQRGRAPNALSALQPDRLEETKQILVKKDCFALFDRSYAVAKKVIEAPIEAPVPRGYRVESFEYTGALVAHYPFDWLDPAAIAVGFFA